MPFETIVEESLLFEARCCRCDGERVYEITEEIVYRPVITVDENGLAIDYGPPSSEHIERVDYWCDDCRDNIANLVPAHSSPNGPPEPIDRGDD